jgi:outer membrane protein assembly factor BamB
MGGKEQRIAPQLPSTQASPQQILVPIVSFTDDKRAYVLTSFQEQSSGKLKGQLYAFDTVNGNLLWDYPLPGTLPDDVLSRTPVLRLSQTADKILALTGSGIFAVNAATGEPVWTYSFTEQSNINLGKVLWNNESYIIAGLGDGRILKLSTLDGTKVWETPILEGLLSEWMAETDGRLYFSIGLLSLSRSMRVLDSDSGEILYAYSRSDFGIASPEGFTTAFNASGEYIINAGVLNVYGFKLPE